MGQNPKTLREQIAANLPANTRRRWEDGLSPEVRADLEVWKADLKAGKLGLSVTRNGLATSIAKSLAEMGIPATRDTVARWLER